MQMMQMMQMMHLVEEGDEHTIGTVPFHAIQHFGFRVRR